MMVWKPEFVAFAAENGRTPEEQDEHDRRVNPHSPRSAFAAWLSKEEKKKEPTILEEELLAAIGHVQRAHRIVAEAGDVEQAQRLTVAHSGLERAVVAAQRKRLGMTEDPAPSAPVPAGGAR